MDVVNCVSTVLNMTIIDGEALCRFLCFSLNFVFDQVLQ